MNRRNRETTRNLIEQELQDIESFILQLFTNKPIWGGLILDTLRGEVKDVFYFFKLKYMIKYYPDHPCAQLTTFHRYMTNKSLSQLDFDQLHL